jgi:hypothetical protein
MASNIGTAISAWSTTAGSNQPDSTDLASTLREDLQAIQAGVRYLRTAGTVASASTTDLATKSEEILSVSGTNAITALGTVSAGMVKVLIFEGALTFTHNATSLILPGGHSVVTAAGDIAAMLSLGSGNWRCLHYTRGVSGGFELLEAKSLVGVGTFTFTGLDTSEYHNYRLYMLMSAGADSLITWRSGDGSIDTGNLYHSMSWSQAVGATSVTVTNGAAASSGFITPIGVNSGVGNRFVFDVLPNGNQMIIAGHNVLINTVGVATMETVGSMYIGAGTAVDRLQIISSNGAFTGVAYLYGIR